MPAGEEKNFRGVVDLVRMKATIYEANGSGKGKECGIPADLAEAATKAHEALVEMVAEGNDKLMEEFFDKGTIPVEDLVPGLRQAIAERRLYPGRGQRRAAQYRKRKPDELHRRLSPRARRNEAPSKA